MIPSQKERMLIVIHGKHQLKLLPIPNRYVSTPRAKVSSSQLKEIVQEFISSGNSCMRVVTGLKQGHLPFT
jgi:hypothetical protein